ncbi:hypothetical protein PVK06_024714 [Gossypium arboreum]|uniref:Uncharacterized protein n=1 Tax=Gossypium arboreum TaxID=29729 RepID=A0ABR0PEP0_GOSAR|nr:hypothetical protein PVK06_024714 [Gossypium arboreum]
MVIETNSNGEKEPNNDGRSDYKGEYFSDLELDEVLDNIDDEGTDTNENVYALSVGNPSCSIVIRNGPKAHMLSVDPD